MSLKDSNSCKFFPIVTKILVKMYCRSFILVLSVVLAVVPIQASFAPQGRMSGGNLVDTLRYFPHHVLIRQRTNRCNEQWSDEYQGERRYCGGSIVNQRWVLTAADCVKHFDVLELSFQRLYVSKTNGSYSMIVNRDSVIVHPTQIDNIALIKLPSMLEISDTVQPIDIYSGPNLAAGQFVVMPGYENYSSYNEIVTTTPSPFSLNCENKMVYGMFSVSSVASCSAELDKDFDQFFQYCTKPWDRTRNTPSPMDIGSGLIVNWRARPQLVGIYAGSNNWKNVAVYTNVAKYAPWIQGIINDWPVYS